MFITIQEWAQNNFSIQVSNTTLSVYAKTGQIYPPPVKFAGRWMVDENAKYVGLTEVPASTDPLVASILHYGQKKIS